LATLPRAAACFIRNRILKLELAKIIDTIQVAQNLQIF